LEEEAVEVAEVEAVVVDIPAVVVVVEDTWVVEAAEEEEVDVDTKNAKCKVKLNDDFPQLSRFVFHCKSNFCRYMLFL
jgi:hypothetical protein